MVTIGQTLYQSGIGARGSNQDACMRAWERDVYALKSAGTAGITVSGAFNAVYGPKIYSLAYNRHNTLASLGVKPYFMGVRFQMDLSNSSMPTTNPNGGVIRGGYKRAPMIPTYGTVEQPYKVNEWNFAMEKGMTKLNNIADIVTWEDMMDSESKTWLNQMNAQVLQTAETLPTQGIGQFPASDSTSSVTSAERVGLESIERIISNSYEAQFLPGSTTNWTTGSQDSSATTGPAVVPWWNPANLPSSDGHCMKKYRDKDDASFSSTSDNNFNAYVDANYTAGTTTGVATNRQINLTMIDNMFNTCMPFWDENSTAGKVMITGYDTLTKLQAILQPQQRFEGSVGAKMSVNGISTVEGRGVGFQVSTYNNVPILPDRMVNRGYKGATTSGVGRVYLLDNEIIGRGVHIAPVVTVSDNIFVVGQHVQACNMTEFSEVQAKGFRGLGCIKHLK